MIPILCCYHAEEVLTLDEGPAKCFGEKERRAIPRAQNLQQGWDGVQAILRSEIEVDGIHPEITRTHC